MVFEFPSKSRTIPCEESRFTGLGAPEEAYPPARARARLTAVCYARLKHHNANKDFWQQPIAVVSKTGSFTKAHARYLEWYCIGRATEVGRYRFDNGNAGSEPFTTEPMRADLMEAFETVNVLTSALGFPVVEPRQQAEQEEMFFCTRRPRDGIECEGKGYLAEDGFTVVAGARGRTKMADYAGNWLVSARRELVEAGVIREDPDGQHIIFEEDYTFKTPSGAAMMLIGGPANGWTEWKEAGRTLDEMKRQQGTDADCSVSRQMRHSAS